MNYYILAEDARTKTPIKLSGFTTNESKHFDDIAIEEKSNGSTKAVDYIKKKFLFDTRHVVSDTVYDVIKNLEEYIDSRAIFVMSEKMQCVYWELKIKFIDFMIKEKNIKIQDVKLLSEKTQGAAIFTMKLEMQEYIIVRFDIAERIMQTCPLGIEFMPIKTI